MAKKKRYHQSKSDRRREHSGMETYERGPVLEHDERRRHREMSEAGYIREDRSAVANMPQKVVMRSYPKVGNYVYSDLNDEISGVDRQMNADAEKRDQGFHPKKV